MTTPDGLMPTIPEKKIAGLTANLWRLALVIGVGQFSMSIWGWQFGIFIETIIEPWQMGLTFTASSIAGLIGVPLSGYVSDFIGRKKTLLIAYIPMAVGLSLLFSYPVWPFLPIFYGLAQFGWSFVVIMAKAAPADQVSKERGKDAAKTFSMVLLPAFVVDGLSPVIASILLQTGYPQHVLLLVGAVGTIVAFVASLIFVRETLSESIQEKAREGPIIAIRGLGRDFWILAGGITGYAFSFGITFPYLGNLIVTDWGISAANWGIIWGVSSLCIAGFSYYGGKVADKKLKPALGVSMLLNSFAITAFALGSGIEVLFLLNVLWAFPIVVWLSSERALIVQGVSEEMKGRAFSTYQIVISSVQIVAMNFGAWIWTMTDNLRYLYLITAAISFVAFIPLAFALRAINLKDDSNQISVESLE
ncbi:MAG: MFS transporter [Candidatus Thorarchaeota archaeon]|nr:MFS transporter [Candidatus Thorarchaeota archaeon]MCK5239540.1 MFS transporter [Candidatus Thorarchaeota archaeon]